MNRACLLAICSRTIDQIPRLGMSTKSSPCMLVGLDSQTNSKGLMKIYHCVPSRRLEAFPPGVFVDTCEFRTHAARATARGLTSCGKRSKKTLFIIEQATHNHLLIFCKSAWPGLVESAIRKRQQLTTHQSSTNLLDWPGSA